MRDVALAHVRAVEVPAAQGKRFFATAGLFSNRQIVEIVRRNFPEYEPLLPGTEVQGGDFPEGEIYGFDNSRTADVLGIKFRSLEESIVELVRSLKNVGA